MKKVRPTYLRVLVMLICAIAIAARLTPHNRVRIAGRRSGRTVACRPRWHALELSSSQEFPVVAAGTYRVTATDVTHFNTVFSVAEPVKRAEKLPAAGLSIPVHYAPHRDASRAAAEALNELRSAV